MLFNSVYISLNTFSSCHFFKGEVNFFTLYKQEIVLINIKWAVLITHLIKIFHDLKILPLTNDYFKVIFLFHKLKDQFHMQFFPYQLSLIFYSRKKGQVTLPPAIHKYIHYSKPYHRQNHCCTRHMVSSISV